MAEILFRPTCSKCNKVICGPVDCKRVENEVMGKTTRSIYSHYQVTPILCPWCGEPFETIVIPTNLPYKPDIFEEGKR